MSMRFHHRLGIGLAFAACGGCVSLNPSVSDMTGRWLIECEGGKETLDLKADGRYVYAIESPSRHVKAEGLWKIEPPVGSTDSTHIVLRNAPQNCDMVDVFKGTPDNTLDPVWEWGYTELSFNHDEGGFRRVASK